jgi:Sigma-70, region 4
VERLLRPAMTLEAIAAAEGTSLRTVNSIMSRALRKLRREVLICTARELSIELEHNRNSEHTVYRRNGRRAGAE